MSSLSDSIKELKKPTQKPSNFKLWIDALSAEDRRIALEAMRDSAIKKYPLYDAFRKNGMKVSKEYFIDVRTALISGELKDEDIR